MAGKDSRSRLLIAFLCSVSRVSIFLEVCPMYCCEQLLQGMM